MTNLSESQLRTRERVESLIRLMAPALDLMLAAGDRVSRMVQAEDHEYYPASPVEHRAPSRSHDRAPDPASGRRPRQRDR